MRRALTTGLCLLVFLTACDNEAPTGTSAPVGPSYDSGWRDDSGLKAKVRDRTVSPTSIEADSTSTDIFGGWTSGGGG